MTKLVLVIIVIALLFALASDVVDDATDESTSSGVSEAEIIDCIQSNPGMDREGCRNQLESSAPVEEEIHAV